MKGRESMAKKVVLPSGTIAELAEYKEQEIEEYRNNPLIEALPPIMDKLEVIDKISVYPSFSESERLLKPHLRYHIIQRLFSYFQPLSIHLDLENKISRLIRQGYIPRNPYNPSLVKNIYEQHKALSTNIDVNCSEYFRSTASSFTILGTSGVGKTTSLNRILSTIPQVLIHNKYKGNNLSLYQLVWIKLDCPFDGSIKGLCLDFFAKVDSVLGTSYYAKYNTGRVSTNAMIPAISIICRQCSIGMIILDEIQHLSMSKSGGANKVLNFIVTLINTVGVPIILVGTPKATPFLQGEFRQARRSEGVGGLVWNRCEKNDSFKLLLEGVWDYQWTKKPVKLNDEFIDIMFSLSMGITDICIKLFIMTQIRAISSGKEEITVSLMEKVAKENLKFVSPMINDIRSGNINRMAKYSDVVELNIEGFLNSELNRISVNNKIKEITEMKKREITNGHEKIREEAILKLLDLDIDKRTTIKYVDDYLQEQKNENNVNNIVKGVLRKLNEGSNLECKKKIAVNKYFEDDLRKITEEGKESGISNYKSLKNRGFIKSISEILEVEVV
jgi:hypothetical protein